MATLAELVAEHTRLEGAVVAHLQRLVAGWGVLSDLCFADLLLFVPVEGRDVAETGDFVSADFDSAGGAGACSFSFSTGASCAFSVCSA